jgi:hypothetical protein
VADDLEITAEWTGSEVTPVARVCPDCAGEQIVLANFVPAPANIREAWAIQRCCGSKNETGWRWCFEFGEITEPSLGKRTSYDRRKVKR